MLRKNGNHCQSANGARSLGSRRGCLCAAAVCAVIQAGPPVSAATLFWDPGQAPTNPTGGNGTWDTGTTTDWSNGNSDVVWTDSTGTDTAVFGGSSGTVTLAATQTANAVVFNTSGYVLSGGSLNLAGSAPTITANANATISSAISGSNGLTLVSGGVVTLTASSTYLGTTNINSGTLEFQNSVASPAINISPGATAQFDGTISQYQHPTTFSGDGTLLKTGSGTLDWSASAFNMSLGGGALIDIEGGTFIGGSYGDKTWTNNLAGLKVASGATFAGNEANVIVDALTGGGTISSGYSESGYSQFTFGANGGGGTFSGQLTDSPYAPGNYTKTGSGTQILTGSNTYTGTTTISGGTLQVGTGGSGSLGSGPVIDNANLIYNVSAAVVSPATGVSGSGNLSVIAPNVTLNGNIALGGTQSLNAGNPAANYLITSSVTLSGSSITMAGVVSQSGGSSNCTLALDTSASNGSMNLNLGFSIFGVTYGPAGFTANSGTGTLTLTNTTASSSGFPATSSLTGALNINDTITNANALALHATANSTVAGLIGLNQSLNGYNSFTVDSGATMTVSAQLAPVAYFSYGGLAKFGGGTVILTNPANNYQQGLQLFGGTVQFLNNALPSAVLAQGGFAADFEGNSTLKFDASDTNDISSGGQINIANGVTATFDTNGTTQTFASAFALQSGAGAAISLNDTSATPGTLIITANNSFTGGTTIIAGTLQVGNGGTTGSIGTGSIVDNGTLAYNRAADVSLPATPGISGSGNVSLISPSTTFNGDVLLSGTQVYNSGNTAARYLLASTTSASTLTGSSISITGEFGQSAANSGQTLNLDTSAANGPITLNLGFSAPNYTYTIAGLVVNAGTGTVTLTNTTTSSNFPATSSLTGALNINDNIPNAGAISLHATGNSTVAGMVGLNPSTSGLSSFNVDNGFTMTVSAAVGGISGVSYGGISKVGGGTLILTNASNTYGAGVQINGGTVSFSNNALAGAAYGFYTADFQGNGTLQFGPGDTNDISGTAAAQKINVASGVTATFDTNGTNQTFGAPIHLGSGAGAAIILTDGSTTPGSLTLASANTYTGGTLVSSGTLIAAASGAIPVSTPLAISEGATVIAASHGSSDYNNNIVVNSLSIAGNTNAWTGLIDLKNNDLIVSGSANLAMITNQIKQGYNAGSGNWQGSGGITSSTAAGDNTHLTALGVVVNDDGSGSPLYTSLDGSPTSDGDVLVKYTYYGDATLNGTVNAADYSRIDNGFLRQLTGWSNGDFNYDGVVNGSDYTLIDNAFNMQGASLQASIANPDATPTAQIGGAITAVPEPTAICLVAFAASSLLGRRRKRH